MRALHRRHRPLAPLMPHRPQRLLTFDLRLSLGSPDALVARVHLRHGLARLANGKCTMLVVRVVRNLTLKEAVSVKKGLARRRRGEEDSAVTGR